MEMATVEYRKSNMQRLSTVIYQKVLQDTQNTDTHPHKEMENITLMRGVEY